VDTLFVFQDFTPEQKRGSPYAFGPAKWTVENQVWTCDSVTVTSGPQCFTLTCGDTVSCGGNENYMFVEVRTVLSTKKRTYLALLWDIKHGVLKEVGLSHVHTSTSARLIVTEQLAKSIQQAIGQHEQKVKAHHHQTSALKPRSLTPRRTSARNSGDGAISSKENKEMEKQMKTVNALRKKNTKLVKQNNELEKELKNKRETRSESESESESESGSTPTKVPAKTKKQTNKKQNHGHRSRSPNRYRSRSPNRYRSRSPNRYHSRSRNGHL
jgi:hypothetical protein